MPPSVFPPLRCFSCKQCTSPVVLAQREGHPASVPRSPAEHPPSSNLPPTSLLLFIPPSPKGLQGDGTPAAVLRAPGIVSHNWHCAIITSHHSNPCLPLLMSYSGPTSVTAVWVSERERTHRLMNSLVGKQDSESQLFQLADVAQRWA